ncbi:DUF6089 family protein [uncultured Mucilaginibacter sp.]|uniref:type IX secretion system protein PorG n=1 Tax=uncultured Mucilaginibacter sp. TaxID=797541 RepID=UPI0025D66518|nr:DUF6089 family protein [uncultured Mucilaginibacter sp.]
MPRLLTIILLFFCVTTAQAQKWEFGVLAGGSGYMGDLNQRNPLQVSGVAAGLFARYNFSGYAAARLSITKAQIEGADSTSRFKQQRDRNLSFFTPLTEVALIGELNFMKYLPGAGYNSFTPYIFLGLASANYNPQANYNGQSYELRPLRTEQQRVPYKNSTLAVPFGAGVKYNILGKLSLTGEVGYRTAYTDRLDDVSGLYASKSSFANPIARALSDRSGERNGIYIGDAGTQRGDTRKHDTYMFFQISLSYTFLSQNCYY